MSLTSLSLFVLSCSLTSSAIFRPPGWYITTRPSSPHVTIRSSSPDMKARLTLSRPVRLAILVAICLVWHLAAKRARNMLIEVPDDSASRLIVFGDSSIDDGTYSKLPTKGVQPRRKVWTEYLCLEVRPWLRTFVDNLTNDDPASMQPHQFCDVYAGARE